MATKRSQEVVLSNVRPRADMDDAYQQRTISFQAVVLRRQFCHIPGRLPRPVHICMHHKH
jgi:hypothetical protein